MRIKLNISSIFILFTLLFSSGIQAAEYPKTLCAYGYITKIEAVISEVGNSNYYYHVVHFDTMGFDSPRQRVHLTMLNTWVNGSLYHSHMLTEATELLRNAFTSHRPVRVFSIVNNSHPEYCNGNPTELKIEVCSNKECST